MMLYHPVSSRARCSAHQDILMRSQCISIPHLPGKILSMYPIDHQCRIELIGRKGFDEDGVPLWEYTFTMPIMCIAENGAARTEVRFNAAIAAPYSEEKLRYGCLLQADCLVCPHSAVQTAPGMYRITYDAHVSLFLSCHACCS